ncbi:MAG: thioredoxin domain-containing protein [Saprospiraceae bacterium]|nr:thioredoxin domain-containing protein [Saprospiraceae bacterium]
MNKSVLTYISTLAILILFTNCNTVSMQNNHKKANKLINESSPYLLQHAYNPVDWYPWGEEALAKAQKENKLLIISVGYAACHWCHVMEHESFEDSTVAQIMNEHFVSIKVDREERPDVDDVYMTAAQLISGRGGWPLNAIALPDGRPVFAGTYYPKKEWVGILNQIVKIKNENPDRLEQTATQLTSGINNSNIIEVKDSAFDFSKEDLMASVSKGKVLYDKTYGGRSGAPKFPMPNVYEFLMKYYWYTGDQEAWDITKISLDKMAKGGIYDQLGGGFARYSVDAFWLVPHFEKMLYDNAQLVSIYAQAYQINKDAYYKEIIENTLSFVERELYDEGKGFYSSLDADSEGEEGKFYVWSENEIDSILGEDEDTKAFKEYYDVSAGGNWEHTNILNIVKDKAEIIEKYGLNAEAFESLITESKSKLFEARSTRIRPGLDDKVLTSWNALMISGYTDAYKALGDEAYLDRAVQTMNFLLDNQMQDDGRLNRNYKDGVSSINAFLDDYALLTKALVDLYQVSFDTKWLDTADKLVRYTIEHFYNAETKMFDYTSKLDPPLIAKKAEYNDNVIPASNSAMARALFSLGTLKYNTDHLDKAQQMMANMLPQVTGSEYLSFYSNWMQLLFDFTKAPYEIAIVGENADAIRKEISKHYLANSIILGNSTEDTDLDLLKDKYVDDLTMIYVCQNKVCKMPVTEVEKALELITP